MDAGQLPPQKNIEPTSTEVGKTQVGKPKGKVSEALQTLKRIGEKILFQTSRIPGKILETMNSIKESVHRDSAMQKRIQQVDLLGKQLGEVRMSPDNVMPLTSLKRQVVQAQSQFKALLKQGPTLKNIQLNDEERALLKEQQAKLAQLNAAQEKPVSTMETERAEFEAAERNLEKLGDEEMVNKKRSKYLLENAEQHLQSLFKQAEQFGITPPPQLEPSKIKSTIEGASKRSS